MMEPNYLHLSLNTLHFELLHKRFPEPLPLVYIRLSIIDFEDGSTLLYTAKKLVLLNTSTSEEKKTSCFIYTLPSFSTPCIRRFLW